VAVLICGLGEARAAPLEAYGRLPVMGQVALSPDGTRVAFVQPVDGKHVVMVDQVNPPAVITALVGSTQKVRSLIWADNDHLLVVKSQSGFAREVESARTEWYLVQSLDLRTRKVTALLNQDHDNAPTTRIRGTPTMNVVLGEPEARRVGGRPMVFARGVAFVDSQGAPALISIDLNSNQEKVLEKAQTDQDRYWIIDQKGAAVAQVTYDRIGHLLSVHLKRGGAWVNAFTVEALNDPPSVAGFSPDGASLVLSMIKDGQVEYRPLTLADGKLGDPTNQYGALSTLIEDPLTQRVIGGVKMGMEPEYVFFDPKDQAAWNAVAGAFPGEDVELVSWSDDRTKVVVQVTGLLHGVVYQLVDLTARKAAEIGAVYQDLKADDLAEVHLANYRAGDGRAIQSFLTLPNGREAKDLPLIVLPHGGPAARDSTGFDWWAQALASRGYAVLQPQFRGSSGFGWELESAGFGQLGRKMQSDLSDGVKALASKGIIDPKRVCIVGASYGGYAALAGVTMEQGVYRCAVAVAGVSDMRRLVGGRYADDERSLGVRYWNRFVGAKDANDPVYDQISPVKHAAKADAPILLIHGRDDTVVPIEQSQRMADALKSAGKPVELVILPSEDHWLSREETRVKMLQATVAFVEAKNPPK
jgi:dipeptidyl aminopeptidase/acylaminoacyl peptidase